MVVVILTMELSLLSQKKSPNVHACSTGMAEKRPTGRAS